MARHAHWTHDSSFSRLRKPPKWYQRRTTPFYTSRPSARMEKQLAEDAERQWHWPQQGQFTEECAKKTLMPWSAYSRTSSRLRLALKGHDPLNIPEEGKCNPDCATFVCCFPFYGTLLAKLQNTVRAFYDIEGSESRDWKDGCCCPGVVLARADHEIIWRENKHSHLKESHEPKDSTAASEPSEDAYSSQAPMEVLAPTPSQSSAPPRARSSSSSSKGKDTERSGQSLSTIPETSREVSGAGVAGEDDTGQAPAKKQTKAHSLDDDSTVPIPVSQSTFPRLNFLDKQWLLVPANKVNENTKPDEPVEILEEVPVKPADRGLWRMFGRRSVPKPTEVTVKHVLAEDARSSRTGTISLKHALEEEPPAKNHGSRFAEHLLENDHVSPSIVPTINVSHELSDDAVFILPASGAGQHGLSEDPSAITRLRSATHGLDVDEQPGDEAPEAAVDQPADLPEDTETAAPDKGFVATFLKGIAQPLRGSQAASAPAEEGNESGEASEAQAPPTDGKDKSKTVGHALADDKVPASQ